jgi:hypothetical protein
MGLGARLARCGVYQNGHGGYRYLYLYLVSRVQLAGVRARAPLSDLQSTDELVRLLVSRKLLHLHGVVEAESSINLTF